VLPHFDDLTGDLVTDDARRTEVLVAVVADLDVSAAGGAVHDPELDLVGAADRLGHLLQSPVPWCIAPQCLHHFSFACRAVCAPHREFCGAMSEKVSQNHLTPSITNRYKQKHRSSVVWIAVKGALVATTEAEPTQRTSARVQVQKFGTFLSNMVMPNIGAFIAWGLI